MTGIAKNLSARRLRQIIFTAIFAAWLTGFGIRELRLLFGVTPNRLQLDLLQVNFLDYLNGENYNDSPNEIFGGSLAENFNFNVFDTWKHVHAFAKSITPFDCDVADFHNMVLCARAHHIVHRVLYDLDNTALHSLMAVSPEDGLSKFKRTLKRTIEKLEKILYPWLPPTVSSVHEMHQSVQSSGTGVVFTCGETHFYFAQHLIMALRNIFNSTLPVEIFYAGEDDLSSEKIEILRGMANVTVINLLNYFPRETLQGSSWSFKPYAILASRFRRVLFMDPDVAFFKDPATVLNSSIFKKYGQVFYRDRKFWSSERTSAVKLLNHMNPNPSRYAMSGAYIRSVSETFKGTTEEMESGFIPVDKGNKGVLLALLLAAKMNGKREREEVFYKASWGDKESYWFAFESLRVPYQFNPSYAGSIGIEKKTESEAGFSSICFGKHLHADEFMQPFWFHDGNVLTDYRYYVPPSYRFSEFTHYGLHYNAPVDDLPWHDGINCLRRPISQISELSDSQKELIKKYQDIFKYEVKEVGVKLVQTKFLDYLNGEWNISQSQRLFGGSLVNDTQFDPVQSWKMLFAHTKQLSVEGYTTKNLQEIAFLAQVHKICNKVLHEVPDDKFQEFANVSGEKNVRRFSRSLKKTISEVEKAIYPWIGPTFSSIDKMYDSFQSDSTGIVMTCGNTHFYFAQHIILSLQKVFSCSLHFEIFYGGFQDLSPERVEFLSLMPNVTVKNLHNYFPKETTKGESWSYKPYAILASQFRKVLFMDPDIAFLKDPTSILRSQLFLQYGQVFFRDRKIWSQDRTEAVHFLRGMSPHLSQYALSGSYAQSHVDFKGSTEEMESGFIPVDKGRRDVLLGLLLAAKMNGKNEREAFYKAAWGDKESYWFAFESLRTPYIFNPSYAGSIGVMPSHSAEIDSNGFRSVCRGKHLHADENMEPFWFHDGGVLNDYRKYLPPSYEFSNLTHIALHYDYKNDEQVWYDGMNCIRRPRNQVFPINEHQKKILDIYRSIFMNEVVEVLETSKTSEWNDRGEPWIKASETDEEIQTYQTWVLDFLNGEHASAPQENDFGGSLASLESFDLFDVWKYHIYRDLEKLSSKTYSPKNINQISNQARAHLIVDRVLNGKSEILTWQLANYSPGNLAKFKRNMFKMTSIFEKSLYPWLPSKFSSSSNLRKSLERSLSIAISYNYGDFYQLLLLIGSLRDIFKISTKVEIFYFGEDLSPKQMEYLSSLQNVTVTNIQTIFPKLPFQKLAERMTPLMRLLSLLASNSRWNIHMDSDVAFLRNPELVLHSPYFQKFGQTYFRSKKIWKASQLDAVQLFHELNPNQTKSAQKSLFVRSLPVDTENNELNFILGTTQEMDGGVIALDKERPGFLVALQFAVKLILEAGDIIGDEALWIASETLRIPYSFSSPYAGAVGSKKVELSGGLFSVICDSRTLQLDHENVPFWIHGNLRGMVNDSRSGSKSESWLSGMELMIKSKNAGEEDQLWFNGGNCIKEWNRNTDAVGGSSYAPLLEEYGRVWKNVTAVE
ncbi:hypothetical protein HDU83_000365 [Entophlyctis luteolus]|nr:hypothetical protein HDU83_000365 [Entophlyctis luteolus]